MTTPLYKCYGCDRQMNAITNNEGNLACAFCGSEFVEELEELTTSPRIETVTNTSPIHSPSPQAASNIVDLTNLDDDDIFSRAFSSAVTTPEQSQTRSSSSTTTTTRSRTSSSGTPTVHSQTISITIGPNGTTRRTFTNATPFNPFAFVGGENNNNRDPLASLFGGFGGGENNRDPISSIFDALNNASQNMGGNNNQQQGAFPRINFGPTMDFSNFMRHIRQPFGNGTTWGDYVFSDNLDDIITRMMEATVGQGGTPPATQEVISKLKHRKAQECDCKDCAVCQDQIKVDEEITELPCGHLYHNGCVTPWLERHANCPICRAEISNDGSALPPHSYQQQQQQQNNNPHNH